MAVEGTRKHRSIFAVETGPNREWTIYQIRGENVKIIRTETGLRAEGEHIEMDYACDGSAQSIRDFLYFLHDGVQDNPFRHRRNPHADA